MVLDTVEKAVHITQDPDLVIAHVERSLARSEATTTGEDSEGECRSAKFGATSNADRTGT